MDPFNPEFSSDNGCAIIFPIIKAITKSINLSCEIDRCPIILAEKSKKKKATTALKIH